MEQSSKIYTPSFYLQLDFAQFFFILPHLQSLCAVTRNLCSLDFNSECIRYQRCGLTSLFGLKHRLVHWRLHKLCWVVQRAYGAGPRPPFSIDSTVGAALWIIFQNLQSVCKAHLLLNHMFGAAGLYLALHSWWFHRNDMFHCCFTLHHILYMPVM